MPAYVTLRRISYTRSACAKSGAAAADVRKIGARAAMRSSNARRMAGSIAAKPPRSAECATRSDARSSGGALADSAGSTRPASASRVSPVARQDSISSMSRAVRAIGPSTCRCDRPTTRFSDGTRPALGRMPTTPHSAAGMRRLPALSEPSASGAMPVASAIAEPPDEPPHVSGGANGLPLTPYTGLNVLPPAPHSGVFVFMQTMPPARRSAATRLSSAAGT